MDSRARARKVKFFEEATRQYHILSTYDKSYVNSFSPVEKAGRQRLFSLWSAFLRKNPGAFLSLYVHVPFCRDAKCFYCMYNSAVPINSFELEAYCDALEDDIRFFSPLFASHPFTTLYIGGGTPSLLSQMQLKRLFAMLFGNFAFKRGGPGTRCFEVSPATVTEKKVGLARDAGINRISMGVQSLDRGVLRTSNRAYVPFERLKKIIRYIKAGGFSDFNIDLMAGLPGDSIKKFLYSFEKIAQTGVPSITVYFYRHYPGAGGYPVYRYPYERKPLLDALSRFSIKAGYAPEGACNEKKEYHVFRKPGAVDLLHNPTEYHEHLQNATLGLGPFSNSFIRNEVSYFNTGGAIHLKRFSRDYRMRQHVLRAFEASGKISLGRFRAIFKKDLCDVFSEEIDCLRQMRKIKVKDGQAFFQANDFMDFSIASKFFYDQRILRRAVSFLRRANSRV